MCLACDRRIILHQQVDQFYRNIIDKIKRTSLNERHCDVSTLYHCYGILDIWRQEEEYIDRFSKRMPRLVNVQAPKGV